MSILNSIRDVYNQIPKEPAVEPKPEVSPTNRDLMDRAIDNLNKQPIVAPNICRKPE